MTVVDNDVYWKQTHRVASSADPLDDVQVDSLLRSTIDVQEMTEENTQLLYTAAEGNRLGSGQIVGDSIYGSSETEYLKYSIGGPNGFAVSGELWVYLDWGVREGENPLGGDFNLYTHLPGEEPQLIGCVTSDRTTVHGLGLGPDFARARGDGERHARVRHLRPVVGGTGPASRWRCAKVCRFVSELLAEIANLRKPTH